MVSKTEILNYFQNDFRPFYIRYGVEFQNNKPQTTARCLWHDDQHPSLSINLRDGTFCCHAGCARGDIFEFYARLRALSTDTAFPQILQEISHEFGLTAETIPQPVPANGHRTSSSALIPIRPLSTELRSWLGAHNKIYSEETLKRFGIGQGECRGESCLIIPIHSKLQKLYFWQRENKQERWQHYPRGKGMLFGDIENEGEVILCEGEWDFLTLWDRGFRNVATGTTGAGSLPKGFAQAFQGKQALIIYDRDSAGRKGARKAAQALIDVAQSVRIIELPEAVGEHGDVSDYFNQLGKSREEFQALLQKARPYSPDEDIREDIRRAHKSGAISPAQDFVNGLLYYAVLGEKQTYLVTSARKLLTFNQAERQGLCIADRHVHLSLFSEEALFAYLDGERTVSAAVLYRSLREYLNRYVVLKNPYGSRYVALWTMGTYVYRIFRYYPYIWVNSLVKGSGKSLLMELVSYVAFNGVFMVDPSPAILYRLIADSNCSIMIDEVEGLRSEDKDRQAQLMAILKSGFHARGKVYRSEAKGKGVFAPVHYPTYSPKMFAGLNEIDDVLRDRTVRIDMVKKMDREQVQYYDEVDDVLRWQQRTRDELYVFGLTYAATIYERYRVQKIGVAEARHLDNRELDIWRPIFVLAHLVDAELGTTETMEAMLAMSRDSSTLKRQEDLAANEVLQLLVLWKEMMQESLVKPCMEETSHLFFRSREVFDYFAGTENFAWLKEVKSLTRRLRRIQIVSEQKYIGTRRERVYRFDPDSFQDNYRRLVGE